MRILIVHNQYQQAGGEDAVVRDEYNLLKGFGEDVHIYQRNNSEFESVFSLKAAKLLVNRGWSRDSYNDMRELLKKIRPDIVHFHNIYYVLTPSVYQACRDEGVAVIQSLHNFRLLCSNALLFRDNKICEECVTEKDLNRGIKYQCYKKSRIFTTIAVWMMQRYWQEKVWDNMVDHFIMASEFGRQKHIDAGIPKEKISVKPHVVYPDLPKSGQDRGYALYVGRLSEEKGVYTLLDAWKEQPGLPLKIAGDGPLAAELKMYVKQNKIPNIEFLGFISDEQYHQQMSGAKVMIVPSICYENFPRIVIEAYAYGLPVIASSLGSFPEIVKEKETGLLFEQANSHDLAQKIRWILAHEEQFRLMRGQVREEFGKTYSSRKNYEILIRIYEKAIEKSSLEVLV